MADIRSSFRQAVASAAAGGATQEVDTRRRAADVDNDEEDSGDNLDDEDDDEAAGDSEDEDAEDDGAETDDESDDEADEGDEDADEGDDDGEDDAGDDDDEGDEDEEPEDGEAGEGKQSRHALNDDKEFKRVQDKYKNNPDGLRKELLKTFTQKTQDIAKERKAYRGLLSYLPLVQAYEADPVKTVQRLARMNGMVVGEDGSIAAPKGKKGTAAATDDDTTEDIVETLLADFKKDLGTDNEYLADQLGPALTKMVKRMTESTVGKRVKPLEEATVSTLRGQAELDSDRVMDQFYTKHPDWADYQDDMDELARQLVGEGDNMRPIPMSEADFLEFLYETVSAKRAKAGHKDRVKLEAKKLMKKRLAKLATARNGDRRPAANVSDDKIRRRPRGPVSVRQAYKAAVAGITFDDSGEDDDE